MATTDASPVRRIKSTVKLTLEEKYGEEMVNFMMGNYKYNEHTVKYAEKWMDRQYHLRPERFEPAQVAFVIVFALLLSAAFLWRSRAV